LAGVVFGCVAMNGRGLPWGGSRLRQEGSRDVREDRETIGGLMRGARMRGLARVITGTIHIILPQSDHKTISESAVFSLSHDFPFSGMKHAWLRLAEAFAIGAGGIVLTVPRSIGTGHSARLGIVAPQGVRIELKRRDGPAERAGRDVCPRHVHALSRTRFASRPAPVRSARHR